MIPENVRRDIVGATRLFVVLGLCAACSEDSPAAELEPPVDAASAAAALDCATLIEKAKQEPALPGAPGFEARRAEILGRSKAEPVLFRRAPAPAPSGSKGLAMLRAQLASSPGWALHGIFESIGNRPELARALLLSEGYLYSEIPDLAATLVDTIELGHLFRDPDIVIQRGAELVHANKSKEVGYRYTDGPEEGQRARLLLLDRVWPEGQDPGPALHLDLRAVAAEVGFERLEVERMTESHVIARARHGADWGPTLFAVAGA